MSRRTSQTDSLDLLLDTICNTFGGVLFIAILVVILLQLSGEPQSAPAQAPVSPDLYRQLQNRHSAAASELAELRKTAASRDTIISEFAPEEIRNLVQERREATAQRDELQAKLDDLTAGNLAAAEDIARTRTSNRELQKSLAEAREHRKTLERQIEELRNSRVRHMALPVARSNFGKGEVAVVVRYGRVYVWHRYGRFGLRLGLNTDDFVVIDEDEVSGAIITQPKPTAGIPLDDTEVTQRNVRARLGSFSPDDTIIAVVVRPDSFGQFQYLRDTLIEMGFEYRLMPAAEGEAIVDRGGSGGKVQ